MKKRILPAVIGLVLAAVFISWFAGRSKSPGPDPASPSPPQVEFPVTDATFDWDNPDGESMMRLVDQLKLEDPGAVGVKFSAVLLPGEEIITEGREVSPGVFEFTKLKPDIVEGGSGIGSAITIRAQRFTIDLEGERGVLSMPTMILPSGSKGRISVGDSEFQQILDVKADLEGDKIRLSGKASEIRQ